MRGPPSLCTPCAPRPRAWTRSAERPRCGRLPEPGSRSTILREPCPSIRVGKQAEDDLALLPQQATPRKAIKSASGRVRPFAATNRTTSPGELMSRTAPDVIRGDTYEMRSIHPAVVVLLTLVLGSTGAWAGGEEQILKSSDGAVASFSPRRDPRRQAGDALDLRRRLRGPGRRQRGLDHLRQKRNAGQRELLASRQHPHGGLRPIWATAPGGAEPTARAGGRRGGTATTGRRCSSGTSTRRWASSARWSRVRPALRDGEGLRLRLRGHPLRRDSPTRGSRCTSDDQSRVRRNSRHVPGLGQRRPRSSPGHMVVDIIGYAMGVEFDLRFRFESDAAYSSQDQWNNPPAETQCLDGAWQLDNITLLDDGAPIWTDDAESNGDNGWVRIRTCPRRVRPGSRSGAAASGSTS